MKDACKLSEHTNRMRAEAEQHARPPHRISLLRLHAFRIALVRGLSWCSDVIGDLAPQHHVMRRPCTAAPQHPPAPQDTGGLNVGRPYSKRRRRLALALLVLVVVAVGTVTMEHELEWQARKQGADLRVKLVGYPVMDPESCGSEDERVLSVFKWAKDNGAYIHPNVSLGFFSLASLPGAPPDTPDITIRGLRATGDIKQGHALFAVPETLLLHVRRLATHHTLGDIYKRVPQLHDDIGGLAVLLITEALNKSSHLRPYLCSLPEHVPLPVFSIQ
jgi:hypothetical protein